MKLTPKRSVRRLAWMILAGILFFQTPVFSQNIGISGDSTINQCETKTYTISIQNTSGSPLSNLTITALLQNFTGFSYVSGTASIDLDGASFCTSDPAISSGYSGNCGPAPTAPYLVWDLDTLCAGGPFTLADGESLNVTFDLATDCSAVSGSLNTYIDYQIAGTPFCDQTGAHSIQVLPGGLTIKKTPNVIPQYIGQNVTWTLTVENTGFGIIENVVVSDELGSGLVYVSSSPAGINAGQTTSWGAGEIAGLASMNPGDIITIDITATVIACSGLDNTADARWGCDLSSDCYNTADTIPPSTAEAAVERLPRTPLLDFSPPDVSFTYCDDTEDVSFTITNIGDGDARQVWLLVDFGSLTVSNLSTGAVYNAAEQRFELSDPIAPGGTYDLSFTLNYSSWCGGTFPSGSLIWQKEYLDECDQIFYPPVELSQINTPSGSTSVSVSKSGAGSAIQIGTQVTYDISSAYSGPVSCGSPEGSVGLMTVVDTLPDGFTVLDAGGGIWVPGTGGTGGTITWTYTPPAVLNTSIILQAPGRSQCEAYCFTTFINSVAVSGVDCCGCTLSDSDSETTAIECEELVNSNKSANPVTSERCDNIEYTNTYDFASAGITLNSLIFTEHAENQQLYEPGSLSVTYDGSDITSCVVLTNTTPGGTLQLDFSGCAADLVDNKNLTIVYQLTITEATAAACAGSSFYSWSTLNMGTSGGECLQDGLIRETTVVSTQPPSMRVDITGLGQIVDQCQTHTITMTLTQTSDVATPKDVRLVLSGLNYYVVSPAAALCSGSVAPTSCTPTIVGDDYVWYFADGFTGSGQNAVIQLDVRKRCGIGGDLVATAYYDDRCNDDGSYDDTCTASDTATPAILRVGDLLIEKNPEIYYATTNTLEWQIYVTNRGSGTAYFVWVDDVLGSGLDYVSAVVDDMTGVTISADLDHEGSAVNGASITFSDLEPGERRKITFTALLIDCSNLTNDVSSAWGCNGVECQTPVTDSSIAQIPRPLLINTNVVTTPSDACSDPDGSITLRNAGQTTCYNLQITETLPAGLVYIPGSTRWRLNSGAWNGPDAAYDPSPTSSPLVWTSTEISALATAAPGDTILIEYDLHADCPFAGGSVTLSTQYENPCGQVFTNADSVFTVAFRAPDITITKSRVNEPIDCGQSITWDITVTNNSGYTMPIIWVEDTLDAAYTYVSSNGNAPYTSDNGTNVGQLVSWELENVPHGTTVNLTLTAVSDSAPCSPDLDNTVQAWWGCGNADGSSSTKPGVDAPDDSLCLGSISVADVRTETRRPTLTYLAIAMDPTTIDSCNDSTQMTIVVENTGPVDASTVDLAIALPAGITFNPGTAEMGLGSDQASATAAIGAIGDPAISGNTVTFYDFSDKGSNLAAVIQAAGGNDTLVLRFTVQSACYTTQNVAFNLRFYDCCDDTQYSAGTSWQLTALFPTLAVTKTADLSSVACGNNVEFTISVTNNGTGNAEVVRVVDTLGSWLDYAGNFTENQPGTITPAIIGGNPQLIGWEFNNLAAGDTATFTFEATLNPDGLPNQASCITSLRQNNASATWACGTTGDAVDDNPNTTGYDCSSSSPASSNTVTVGMPNLVATAITPVISCTADGSFSGSISVTVQNQGDGASNPDFTVQVTDGKGWTGTGSHSGIIAAGNSVTVTIDVTSWTPGCHACAAPYSFNAVVDRDNDVCECNESDNAYGPRTYTAPIPDLVVNSITPSCSGDGLSLVVVNIGNVGCVNVSSSFTLHLEDDQGHSRDITVNSLNAGAASNVSFTNWPTSCSPSNINFTAIVDYNNTICECDGANTANQAYSNTSPDLVISNVTPSVTCSADGTLSGNYEVEITNNGNGPVGGDFRISINDGQGWISQPWFAATLGGTLPIAAGSSATVTIPWTRSFTTTPYVCSFPSIALTVDSSAVICECAGSNNTAASSFTMTVPNLRVLSVTPTCLSDGSYAVAVSVDNNGCGDASGVVVQLADNDGHSATQSVDLAAGDSDTLTFTPWPADGNPVALIFTATIDPSSAVCELSAADNSANSTFNRPNLDLVSVTPSCVADTSFQVSLVIGNIGTAAISNDFVVRLSDNDGHISDQNFTAIGGTLPFNAATQQTVVFSGWTVDGNPTSLTFTGLLDPSSQVCETMSGDNTETGNLMVNDLRAVSVSADASCTADGTLSGTMDVTVQNTGGNAISSDFHISVNDGQGWSSELWYQADLGGTLPLGTGASDTVTFNWARSFTATPNVCSFNSIVATVDSQGEICESISSNNTASGTYTLSIPDLVIDSVASSITCLSDGNLTGTTVRVRNAGCGDAGNVVVRLTSDCGLTFTDQTVNLVAGASEDVFFSFSSGITGCSCNFVAVIDPDSAICELDGSNNSAVSNQVMSIPDLEVSAENLTLACADDGQFTVTGTVTLENNGCGEALVADIPMRFTLFSEADCSGSPLAVWTQTFTSVNLTSLGGIQTFTVTPHFFAADLCSVAGDCDVSINIEADYSDSICEWDGSDNTLCANKTHDCIDMETLNLIPRVLCRNDGNLTGTLTLTLRNSGGNSLDRDFYIRFSDGNGWELEQLYQADLGGTLPLPVGEAETLEIGWDRRFDKDTCQFTDIEVQLDSRNEYCQCSSGNDRLSSRYLLQYPNLNVTAIEPVCSKDGMLRVRVRVENDGCGDAGAFALTLRDGRGLERTVVLSGLARNETIWTDFENWPFSCEPGSLTFSASLDRDENVCEMENTGNILTVDYPLMVADLVIAGGAANCRGDGAIVFTGRVDNVGNGSPELAILSLFSDTGILLHTLSVSPGNPFSFSITDPSPGQSQTFRLQVDSDLNECECNGQNNETMVTLRCEVGDEPLLILDKVCPPGQERGGIFSFEMHLRNNSSTDLEQIVLRDFLPAGFEYVPGSSLLNGQKTRDPEIGNPLIWRLGTLPKDAVWTVIFSAVAAADIDAGQYCNQARVTASRPGDSIALDSNLAECCTVVVGEPDPGCCLQLEVEPLGAWQVPPIPLVKPTLRFDTASAMLTVFGSLDLWRNEPPAPDSYNWLVQQRLREYALATMREHYLHSAAGLLDERGALKLSFAASDPIPRGEEDPRWIQKNADRICTPAQIARELLALDQVIRAEGNAELRNGLEKLFEHRLRFLTMAGDDLPMNWKIQANQEVRQEGKASLLDRAELYWALNRLSKRSSLPEALLLRYRRALKDLDQARINREHLSAELFFCLALEQNGEKTLLTEKRKELLDLFNQDRLAFRAARQLALAAAVIAEDDAATAMRLMEEIKNRFQNVRYQLVGTPEADGVLRVELEDLGALLLAVNRLEPRLRDEWSGIIDRHVSGGILFVRPENTVGFRVMGDEAHPLALPHRDESSQRPVRPAPVYVQDALILPPEYAPLPLADVTSPWLNILPAQTQVSSGGLALNALQLMWTGHQMSTLSDPLNRENGRNWRYLGHRFLETLLTAASGYQSGDGLFVPEPHMARKGRGEHLLSPDSQSLYHLSDLAALTLAERAYLQTEGREKALMHSLLRAQEFLVDKLLKSGIVPESFVIDAQGQPKATGQTPARGIDLARLAEAFPNLKESLLGLIEKGTDRQLNADDLLFLFQYRPWVSSFTDALERLQDVKGKTPSLLLNRDASTLLLGQKPIYQAEWWNLTQNLPMAEGQDRQGPADRAFYQLGTLFLGAHLLQEPPMQPRLTQVKLLLREILAQNWHLTLNGAMQQLPSDRYYVEQPATKTTALPGDRFVFRVTVDTLCLDGRPGTDTSGTYFIRGRFDRFLDDQGHSGDAGLTRIGDFRWRHDGLAPNGRFSYLGFARIPQHAPFGLLGGEFHLSRSNLSEELWFDWSRDEHCEDLERLGLLQIVPEPVRSGVVFADQNGNGQRDAGEPGISGVRIRDDLGRTVTSDADGRFSFTMGDRPRYLQLMPDSVAAEYLLDARCSRWIEPQDNAEAAMPLIPQQLVMGTVYEDQNENGVRDESEPALADVAVEAGGKRGFSDRNGTFTLFNTPVQWRLSLKVSDGQPLFKGSLRRVKIETKTEGK